MDQKIGILGREQDFITIGLAQPSIPGRRRYALKLVDMIAHERIAMGADLSVPFRPEPEPEQEMMTSGPRS